LNGSYRQALALLAVAGLTDGLDGFAARRLGCVTRFGASMDPIADKVLLVTVYLSLGAAGLIPGWLVWIVVGRDVAILAVAGLALLAGWRRDFAPSVWGKLSTLVQIVTGLAVLGSHAVAYFHLSLLAEILPSVTAVTTIWSGLHYAWRSMRTAHSSDSARPE
jgi:cardiolipin synthase